jgi:hypothetical protein
MYEKELYPAVEKLLKSQNNCHAEYAGTELSLKSGKTNFRADVFGVSNEGEKIICLCEGKKSDTIKLIKGQQYSRDRK